MAIPPGPRSVSFFFPAFVGVDSLSMFRKLTKPIVMALLIFQLAVGLPWPVADASPFAGGPDSAQPEHCLSHGALAGKAITQGAKVLTRPLSVPHAPMDKHGCCGTYSCQCH